MDTHQMRIEWLGLGAPARQGCGVKVEQHHQELSPLLVPWVRVLGWGDIWAWGLLSDEQRSGSARL